MFKDKKLMKSVKNNKKYLIKLNLLKSWKKQRQRKKLKKDMIPICMELLKDL